MLFSVFLVIWSPVQGPGECRCLSGICLAAGILSQGTCQQSCPLEVFEQAKYTGSAFWLGVSFPWGASLGLAAGSTPRLLHQDLQGWLLRILPRCRLQGC